MYVCIYVYIYTHSWLRNLPALHLVRGVLHTSLLQKAQQFSNTQNSNIAQPTGHTWYSSGSIFECDIWVWYLSVILACTSSIILQTHNIADGHYDGCAICVYKYIYIYTHIYIYNIHIYTDIICIVDLLQKYAILNDGKYVCIIHTYFIHMCLYVSRSMHMIYIHMKMYT